MNEWIKERMNGRKKERMNERKNEWKKERIKNFILKIFSCLEAF
jgi:hypothetical protein